MLNRIRESVIGEAQGVAWPFRSVRGASADYTASQAWARAIHGANPRWDGIRYVSRQMNKGFAYAIFERSGLHKLRAEKLKARQVDDLCDRFNVTAV